MSHVEAEIGQTPYAVTITAGAHGLIADEGPGGGGAGAGFSPYDLVLAGLGACTAMTMKMYAERKGWSFVGARVSLTISRDGEAMRIDRLLTLDGDLDEVQRDRLADIAERTPVTLTLKTGVAIHTRLA